MFYKGLCPRQLPTKDLYNPHGHTKLQQEAQWPAQNQGNGYLGLEGVAGGSQAVCLLALMRSTT